MGLLYTCLNGKVVLLLVLLLNIEKLMPFWYCWKVVLFCTGLNLKVVVKSLTDFIVPVIVPVFCRFPFLLCKVQDFHLSKANVINLFYD